MKQLTIANNISQKDGFLLLDYWTLGLGKRNYKTVNTWKANAFRYWTVKWLFRHNGRMDIWLDDYITEGRRYNRFSSLISEESVTPPS